MKELKFELSILFTKTEVSPYTRNDLIKDEYFKLFGKEVKDEDLVKMLGEILDDQIEMYNNYIQEIPDDYEMNDRNR